MVDLHKMKLHAYLLNLYAILYWKLSNIGIYYTYYIIQIACKTMAPRLLWENKSYASVTNVYNDKREWSISLALCSVVSETTFVLVKLEIYSHWKPLRIGILL